MLHDEQHLLVYTSFNTRETLLEIPKQASLRLLFFFISIDSAICDGCGALAKEKLFSFLECISACFEFSTDP